MDVKGIICKADLKFNEQKFKEFVNQYRSEIESGEITYEELHSLAMERLSEFLEIKSMDFVNDIPEE